jgi:hypothetical protein
MKKYKHVYSTICVCIHSCMHQQVTEEMQKHTLFFKILGITLLDILECLLKCACVHTHAQTHKGE